jgi:hypothetical protein
MSMEVGVDCINGPGDILVRGAVQPRPLVATHPIIEQIIDSNLHHLNVRVVSSESVAGESQIGQMCGRE